MNTQENLQQTNCLALTVRKEHRLIAINKAVKSTAMVSFKVMLFALTLTLVNMFI